MVAGAAAALLLAAVAAVAVPGTAAATWSAGSAADAAGRAAAMVMPAGNTPLASTISPGSSSVVVSWPASQNGIAGVPLDGYEVGAFDATSGLPRTVGTGCDGVVAGVTCIETGVPAGTWRYAVTPRRLAWAGAKSGLSDPVVVLLGLSPPG